MDVSISSPIRALVFDFDGLIVDTEEPIYRSWLDVFREHGLDLPVSVWVDCIGRPSSWFDPLAYLEEQLGRSVDRESIRARQRKAETEQIGLQPVLPGVAEYVEQARQLGLGLAVASSSSRTWVTGHLNRLGFIDHWHFIHSRDDVEHAKPDPDLYLAAVRSLGVAPHETIAFEDSLNGVRAAKAAGLYCVAVPNALTATLDLSEADLQLRSLTEMPLADLIARFE